MDEAEREEKKRLRRERIKRILEDDGGSASARGRARGGSSDEILTRTSARRQATTSTVERSRSRPDLVPSRSRRALRETTEETETTRSSSPSSLKARREARRKRNEEHELAQNALKNKPATDEVVKNVDLDNALEVTTEDKIITNGDHVDIDESKDAISTKHDGVHVNDIAINDNTVGKSDTTTEINGIHESVGAEEVGKDVQKGENGISEQLCTREETREEDLTRSDHVKDETVVLSNGEVTSRENVEEKDSKEEFDTKTSIMVDEKNDSETNQPDDKSDPKIDQREAKSGSKEEEIGKMELETAQISHSGKVEEQSLVDKVDKTEKEDIKMKVDEKASVGNANDLEKVPITEETAKKGETQEGKPKLDKQENESGHDNKESDGPSLDVNSAKDNDVAKADNELKSLSSEKDSVDGGSEVKTDQKVTKSTSDAKEKDGKNDGISTREALKKDPSPRKGKLKIDGDSWKKDTRRRKGSAERDRTVEMNVLNRTGKMKNKLKSCQSRDAESADQWKKEIKTTAKKHKSLDEEAQKELSELSRRRELGSIVKACNAKDAESAKAWTREVKKKAKEPLDEEREDELKEVTKESKLKSLLKECQERDEESAAVFKKIIKQDANQLDAEREDELRAIAQTSALKSRIQECEAKDVESAEAWKKKVKEGDAPPKISELEESEEMKEFAESGRLKNLIESCAEREGQKDKSWETAKKCEDNEELKELAMTVDVKSRIKSTLEDREREPDEPAKTVDLTEGEELRQINLKGRINAYKEEVVKVSTAGAKKDGSEAFVPISEETASQDSNIPKPTSENSESRENVPKKNTRKISPPKTKVGRSSSFQKGGSVVPGKKEIGRLSPSKFDKAKKQVGQSPPQKLESGRLSPTKKIDGGTTSPTRKDVGKGSPIKHGTDKTTPTKADPGRTSPTKADSGRISPTKPDSGRISPTKPDSGRISPTKADSGRISPTKADSGRISPTKADSGRISPTKADSGRTSPTKKESGTLKEDTPSDVTSDSGRASPSKSQPKDKVAATKKDTSGRNSPIKDRAAGKSKLSDIRSTLLDGGKNKYKSKRESLERVTKKTSIKDKIAACKQRDKNAPVRQLPEKAPPKAKPKTVAAPDSQEDVELIPVNRAGEEATNTEEEPINVDLKEKMSYWEAPKTDEVGVDDEAAKEAERQALLLLGSIKQAWEKKNRRIKTSEFIKALLDAKCKRRDIKDIAEVKSDTKKYLVLTKEEPLEEGTTVTAAAEAKEERREHNVDETVRTKNKKNLESSKSAEKGIDLNSIDDFSLDDIVDPDEVKQLQDITSFRRQVKPRNRRAAKSNPLKKLQQRKDIKSEADIFEAQDDQFEEEEEVLVPTSIGRLGKPIEPGDRKKKANTFDKDALAGLSAKEDMSKISLKKTAKSRKGISQEKNTNDGTAPVMLMQIKGHRHMQTRIVEPSCDSLNSGDTFLALINKSIFLWTGKDSNVMKKSKASEIANKIIQYKLLNCTSSTIANIKDTNVSAGTGLRRNFWDKLGGQTKVKTAKEVPQDGEYEKALVSTNIVYEVDTSGETVKLEKSSELCGKIPSIKMLDSDKAFVFDFGTEVYVWLGRTCESTTRAKAVELGQEIFKGTFHVDHPLNPITPNNPAGGEGAPQELERPQWAIFGRMTERAETILFQEKFLDWPDPKMKEKLDKQKDLLNKNLSGGYEKRKEKLEPKQIQIIELVPCEGKEMAEAAAPVEFILEGVNVARGRGSYDEVERRALSVTTNSVTVYHSSDKEYRQLEEKEWGHFYSAESYVIRWSYCARASGIRSLKGGESKHDDKAVGRDMIAYFFWHGRDCSASGKGTSALATIELDSDKSPQIMVDEGTETACFLNMFDGQMIVHHGKLNDTSSTEEDNVLMYCVQHEDERETSLIQIEARSGNLRSRSSYIVVIIEKSVGICVWHGCTSTKEKKEGALRGAKRLAVWYQGLYDLSKCDIIELDEGNEGAMFWQALDGQSDYGSLAKRDGKSDGPLRLFYFTSTEGPFVAKEVLDSTRGELTSPYPFSQSELYSASQPALFFLDAVSEMYLWQGWWPLNLEESDTALTTGSAEFQWHRDRRLAMQSIQSYADVVGRQMSKSYVVNAGLEPVEFRAYFPYWEDRPDVTKINLQKGEVNGKKTPLLDLLAKLSRDRYTLAELQVRPLPEGVDPSKMEVYLSDEEFKEVFKMTKDEFAKLPNWKKLDHRKNAGLF